MTMNNSTLLVGTGTSATGSATLLNHQGIPFDFCDDQEIQKDRLDALTKLGGRLIGQKDIDPKDYQTMIVSPGIPPNHPLLLKAQSSGLNPCIEIDHASHFLSQDTKYFGITGTNGKSTICKILEHLLTMSGREAIACGNIGRPLSIEAIEPNPRSYIPVELSSYQLEYLKKPTLEAGVFENFDKVSDSSEVIR